ncbi:MAG: hypothetical protein FWH12_04990 [Treponema sp.]|nr:hypothetical protein [Treponema sp.]
MTIMQTVEIPENRQLVIDVPQEIPAGKANIELHVQPIEENTGSQASTVKGATVGVTEGSFNMPLELPLKCLEGVDTALVDSLIGTIPDQRNKTGKEILVEALLRKHGLYPK